MDPQQIKRKSISTDARQVRKPICTSVAPSAAEAYQGSHLYDDNRRFSRNNPAYGIGAK